MKLITAIIRPHTLEEVRGPLQSIGVSGLTVTEVKGYGRQQGHTELYRGAEYRVSFVPKIKLEIALDDALLDQVVEAISGAARTGAFGDGKLFIQDLDQVFRIRTGESGASAL
ncbi:nitrogen regulatory protein P-II family [Amphritea atlantica]|uniref:Nitrogen regulatory protein P-II family n=1 Tax=Amphritea atlantica TaxID=355243 RepID=A0A1H9D8N8_9GAMM|nr:P-II family nitrogen regulator [Amphritea atlantica]SEQ09729.1 nitrogen regulatory protein P-II family [Amphritea atlantica]